MAGKILNDDKKQIFINSWKGRRWLKLHGFITDSEDRKIRERLAKYQVKNNISATEKDLY